MAGRRGWGLIKIKRVSDLVVTFGKLRGVKANGMSQIYDGVLRVSNLH